MVENKLRIGLAQYDIVWENKNANLEKIEQMLISQQDKSDLLILPEMCTTGFSMNAKELAESNDGESLQTIKALANKYNIAICGTFIALDNNQYYNRAFFISSSSEYYYDKKHLFRMGRETEIYSAGNKKIIFEHKGFNICLLVCYDLRFPVWARNKANEYDLLIYMANWPSSRSAVWNALLTARALENMAYVCGVNRVGDDGMNLHYVGDSKLIDAKGKEILSSTRDKEEVVSITIDKASLTDFREKFPVWKDSDNFEIK